MTIIFVRWEEDQELIRLGLVSGKSVKEKIQSPYQLQVTRTSTVNYRSDYQLNLDHREESQASTTGAYAGGD